MSTLADFLLARIAEDEEDARTALIEDAWSDFWIPPPVSVLTVMRVNQHIARHDPARVLAECDAKRRMLALLDEVNDQGIPRLTIYTRDIIPRTLALPYADHPDYDEAWRP